MRFHERGLYGGGDGGDEGDECLQLVHFRKDEVDCLESDRRSCCRRLRFAGRCWTPLSLQLLIQFDPAIHFYAAELGFLSRRANSKRVRCWVNSIAR